MCKHEVCRVRIRKLEIGTGVSLGGLNFGLKKASKNISGWSKNLDKSVDADKLGESVAKKINASIKDNLKNLKTDSISLPKLAGGFAIGSVLGNGITSGISSAFGAAKGLLGQSFGLAIDKEQTEIAYGTLLGSAEKAKAVIKDLSDFGANTPFEFGEVSEAGKKLLSFGFDADELVPKMTQIGDVASALNIPFSELAEMLGKQKTTGTIFSEDLNQMAGRGVPIFTSLAKVMGVSVDKVKGLASAGKIKFENVEEVFTNLTKEGGQFSGMMAAQSQTVGGLISTLKDNFNLALTTIAEGLFDTFNVKEHISTFIGYLSNIGPMVSTAMGYLKAGVDFVSPFVVSIGEKISGIFTKVVSVARLVAPIFFQYINTISSYIGALYDIVSTGLSTAVSFIGSVIGSALGSVSSFFGGTGNVITDFKNKFDGFVKGSVAFLAIFEYGFMNWRDVVNIGVNTALYKIVSFGGQIKHLFTSQIPAYLMWFAKNGFTIIKNLFINYIKLFENFGRNVVNIITSVPDMLSGNFDFSSIFVPLNEGMVTVFDNLPEIPDRIEGDLEKNLRKQNEQLKKDFTIGLDAHIETRMKDAFEIADTNIEPSIENKIEMPELPKVDIPKVEISSGSDTKFAKGAELGSNEARATLLKHFGGGFKNDAATKQVDIATKQLKVQEETLRETRAARQNNETVEEVSI